MPAPRRLTLALAGLGASAVLLSCGGAAGPAKSHPNAEDRRAELLQTEPYSRFYVRYYARNRAPIGAVPGLYRVLTAHGHVMAASRRPYLRMPPADEWQFMDQLWAGEALARLGAVDLLVDVLSRHPDAPTRWVAARSLGHVGPAAVSAVPDLRRALTDPNPLVRRGAVWTLGRLAGGATPAIPDLQVRLRDREDMVRGYARTALRQLMTASVSPWEAQVMILDLEARPSGPRPRVRLEAVIDSRKKR